MKRGRRSRTSIRKRRTKNRRNAHKNKNGRRRRNVIIERDLSYEN